MLTGHKSSLSLENLTFLKFLKEQDRILNFQDKTVKNGLRMPMKNAVVLFDEATMLL